MFAATYHETTKHYFDRFARSAGRLDWATQPDPFRRFAGCTQLTLPRQPVLPDVPYEALFEGSPVPAAFDELAVGDFLRCALGLSAWKQYQASRWALRVNPSSGNLHPTEGYIVWRSRVWHYLPREHALEERCALNVDRWPEDDLLLVGLSSIFWREAWKYGERAYRYCQHDVGHAIGALRCSAARLGWNLALLPWSDDEVAGILGLDRDADFADAEREAPECLAIAGLPAALRDAAANHGWLSKGARHGDWRGQANRLSPRHVEWEVIEQVAAATEYPGEPGGCLMPAHGRDEPGSPEGDARGAGDARAGRDEGVSPGARAIILQRRSAVAFDGRSTLDAGRFIGMLERLLPPTSPWDCMPWTPQVNLVIFVHRVDGLTPGVYAFLRRQHDLDGWRAAMRPEFLWDPVARPGGTMEVKGLFLLLPIDTRWPAMRVSCDQDIAGDGFFSLGMIARFELALREYGEWFYRRLFWECGLIGQVLYLEAEAAGARSTGIGCYYDDAVHEMLGLSSTAWQSLYHFSMGAPVHDQRIATEKGYAWD